MESKQFTAGSQYGTSPTEEKSPASSQATFAKCCFSKPWSHSTLKSGVDPGVHRVVPALLLEKVVTVL